MEFFYFFLFTELTEYILSQDVDYTVTTCTGDTILHGGVHGNQPEVVDILIKAGEKQRGKVEKKG